MRTLACALLLLLPPLTGCQPASPVALGTLERERITLPAPVSERIAEIAVHEGERVEAGQLLLVLEEARTAARVQVAEAELEGRRQLLAEAREGARPERIEEARQRVQRARTLAAEATREAARVAAVVERGLLPRAERDRARTAAEAAAAETRAAQAGLDELQHGTRSETIAQAVAAVRAGEAQLAALAVDLERVRLTAPRGGVVDSLPFEIGDQPAPGAPLVVMLVGERPHARVHVPQPLRLGLQPGSAATVHLQGVERAFPAHVRSIRSEASYTPYYALTGEDSAQLSYLAEIELEAGDDVDALPIGVPVRVEFAAAEPR